MVNLTDAYGSVVIQTSPSDECQVAMNIFIATYILLHVHCLVCLPGSLMKEHVHKAINRKYTKLQIVNSFKCIVIIYEVHIQQIQYLDYLLCGSYIVLYHA